MYGGKFAFQNRLGLLIVGRRLTVFAFFYFVFEGNFSKHKIPGAYIGGAISRRVFCVMSLGELIHGGAYFGILR